MPWWQKYLERRGERLRYASSNKILTRFPQILHHLPREGQIRDIKSASSCGGFYPKCLKRVHKRAQSSQRGKEKERGEGGVGKKKKLKKYLSTVRVDMIFKPARISRVQIVS